MLKKFLYMFLISFFICACQEKTKKKIVDKQNGVKGPVVVMETSMGNIEIELNKEKAPTTVNNFLRYVNMQFYNDLIFHRVMKDFMIQTGGLDEQLKKRQGLAPIKNESDNGLKNLRGTVAMARTGNPHSATSQFFINVVDNAGLDYSARGHGYAVFGKVIKGMDVVDKIRAVAVGPVFPHQNVPLAPIKVTSIKKKKSGAKTQSSED